MREGDVTKEDEATHLPVPFIIPISRDNSLADSDQVFINVGFRPSYVWILMSQSAPSDEPASIGFASGSAAGQMAYMDFKDGGVTDRIAGSISRLVSFTQAAPDTNFAVLKTFDVDGLTITWTKTGTPANFTSMRILCFK